MLNFRGMKLKGLQKKAQTFFDNRQASDVSEQEIAKEIAIHRQLAAYYQSNSDESHAVWLCEASLRAAAQLGDDDSSYSLGKRLLDRGRYFLSLQHTFYANPIYDKYAHVLFEEGLAYLQIAEEHGHVYGKRLRGLAILQGWGVEKNETRGLELIVASIEQDNAWDHVGEILGELGLDKQKFFTAIMSLRQS